MSKVVLFILIAGATLLLSTPIRPQQNNDYISRTEEPVISWADVHMELARIALVEYHGLHAHTGWDILSVYFTPAMRKALSLRSNSELPPESPIGALLVRDAYFSHLEHLRLDQRYGWGEITSHILEEIIKLHGRPLLYYLQMVYLYDQQKLFWEWRVRELFPPETDR